MASPRDLLGKRFYIKIIRADANDFFRHEAIMGLTRSPVNQIKYELRKDGKRGKKKFTVQDQVYERDKKPPTLPPEVKQAYSQHQSFSVIDEEAGIAPQGFGSSTTRAQRLVGIALNRKDVIPNRLFRYDNGTYGRPYDFNTENEATAYYQRKVYGAAADPMLFPPNKEEEYIQALQANKHQDLHNEPMLYAKWNTDSSSMIIVASNNLESRLLAIERAQVLYNRLVMQANEKGEKLPVDYKPPIAFYLPNDPSLHLQWYTIEQQKEDQLKALAMIADPAVLKDKMTKQDFEILLALPDTSDLLAGKYDQDAGCPVMETILKSGHMNIFLSLYEKASLEAQSKLIIPISAFGPSPSSLYRKLDLDLFIQDFQLKIEIGKDNKSNSICSFVHKNSVSKDSPDQYFKIDADTFPNLYKFTSNAGSNLRDELFNIAYKLHYKQNNFPAVNKLVEELSGVKLKDVVFYDQCIKHIYNDYVRHLKELKPDELNVDMLKKAAKDYNKNDDFIISNYKICLLRDKDGNHRYSLMHQNKLPVDDNIISTWPIDENMMLIIRGNDSKIEGIYRKLLSSAIEEKNIEKITLLNLMVTPYELKAADTIFDTSRLIELMKIDHQFILDCAKADKKFVNNRMQIGADFANVGVLAFSQGEYTLLQKLATIGCDLWKQESGSINSPFMQILQMLPKIRKSVNHYQQARDVILKQLDNASPKNVNQRNYHGEPIFLLALATNDLLVIKKFIECGAEYRMQNFNLSKYITGPARDAIALFLNDLGRLDQFISNSQDNSSVFSIFKSKSDNEDLAAKKEAAKILRLFIISGAGANEIEQKCKILNTTSLSNLYQASVKAAQPAQQAQSQYLGPQ